MSESTSLPQAPRAGFGLPDVLPAVLTALGVSGFDDSFGLEPTKRAVVMVIDGLGAEQLVAYADHAPFLASMQPIAPSLDAAFPTTTPTGLTSIGTGLGSGEHGVVGAAFRLDAGGPLLRPLHWGSEPAAHDVQPNATAWEQAAWSGVHVAAVSPRQYHDSGLTAAALRGATPIGGDSPGEVAANAIAQVRAADRSLVYAYHPTLDRTGHIHGVGSEAWLADLAHVDLLARATAAGLPSGSAMFLTADHGMVNVEAEGRIDVTNDSALSIDVETIGGEPRMRMLYVRRGAAADVARRWSERLGHAAWVVETSAAIEADWFGPVDADVTSRLADVLVLAKPGFSLLADFDRRTGRLAGQHGSLTPAEVRVPLLSVRA